ncbi:F-UL20 egress protein [Chelonid alphaherpesvirus 5]|uniref:F-UL20 egress protein n=2 Tax=Chelonid alphaherpesvirus 5 TaxID=702736 RepID=V5NWW9_9ALPH|nr:F-UL20 egress protein [Chelonid alphaherpesvirus 5]AAU84524.1 UL20 [Fibropapilloma-associated turtle herpesvirus]AHA93345.1 F-UL20 egress protein [Chelonid alphaherpesvirus 5]
MAAVFTAEAALADLAAAPLISGVENIALTERGPVYRTHDDYLISTGQLEDEAPVCTKSTLVALIAAALLKFVNCLIYYVYYRCTTVNVFFIVSIFITAIYYLKVAYMLFCAHANIRADRLPYTWHQRVISCFIDVACPSYFVYVFYQNVFVLGDFFVHVFKATEGACVAVSYVFFVSLMMYVFGIVYDVTEFVFPRLWARALLRVPICY